MSLLSLRPALDKIRSIGSLLGLREFTVSRYERSYARATPHGRIGPEIIIETPIEVDGHPPLLKLLLSQDIISSQQFYKSGDYRIGPLTPAFSGGGVEMITIDPAPYSGEETEVFFKIVGPGLKASGELFRKVKTEIVSPLVWYVVVRRANVKA